MKNFFKPLLAAGSLMMVLAAAGAGATTQPPEVTPMTAGNPSASAAAMQAPRNVPFRPPSMAAAPAVTADDAPSAPPSVPAPAAPGPALAPSPVPGPARAPNLEESNRNASSSNQYVVVAGDTVSGIASRFGVDADKLLAANGLNSSALIVPGQTLKLSGPAIAPPAAAAVAAAVRTIYVAGSGGQAMVDRCIGPIHYTPTDAYSLFITEHDWCGGWARFSGIGIGETVNIAGWGTYTATSRGVVPQGGTTNDVAVLFGGFPRVILQTCIPGTTQTLLIALN